MQKTCEWIDAARGVGQAFRMLHVLPWMPCPPPLSGVCMLRGLACALLSPYPGPAAVASTRFVVERRALNERPTSSRGVHEKKLGF